MIKNFFTTAIRNIFKHRIFSLLNVLGLSIGIAACLLILQYVVHEWSYDTFHSKKDRIFRLQQDRYNEGKLSTQWAAGATGIGPLAKEAVPEIESFARLRQTTEVLSVGEKKFREEKIFFATDEFLSMFSYPLISGQIKGALTEPKTAVVSRSTAMKYYGTEDVIGKILTVNGTEQVKITAVLQDAPANTHLKFNVLISFSSFLQAVGPDGDTQLNWDGFYTYVLLKPQTSPALVEKKIAQALEARMGADFKAGNTSTVYHLQPLTDIHLYSKYMMEIEANGNGESVKFLLIIACFIIVIAWINYINLSTARSIERAKEVGVRKVLGSHRMQLIRQFLLESFIINFIALVIALLLVVIFLPLFTNLTGRELSFSLISEPWFWGALAALFLGGSLLSGLYPAFVLSSFKPISVLKGKLVKTSHGAFLRQSLVILQFAASVALMIGTYSVYRQLQYMEDQDLGININQTLVLRGPQVTDSTYDNKFNAFKTEMKRLSLVDDITASTEVPGQKVDWNAGGIRLAGSDPKSTNQYRVMGIDYDFINAFNLKIVAGRNFSEKFSTDPNAVLFNLTGVKLLGFNDPNEALNKKIEFWGEQYTIIGIVSDHHQESLREAYDAHIFRLIPDARNYYSLKVDAGKGNPLAVVEAAKTKWESFFPGNPFEYFFLDEHYARQYQSDRMFGQTFAVFSILAIIVACLGLFGLASFVTTQRTKEIGIRKISGASIPNIVGLLTTDFIKPVLISFVLALPVTYYLLTKWLENYHFQMPLSIWLFILPPLMILVIAMITVSSQTIRAATANPVKSLRSE